ncbi:MAG TPA: hypothetical protein PKC17_14735, partial [Geobacter anodireducens]|nr:hypothetical protein [Geobacter anodireducens]
MSAVRIKECLASLGHHDFSREEKIAEFRDGYGAYLAEGTRPAAMAKAAARGLTSGPKPLPLPPKGRTPPSAKSAT